MLVVGTRPEAIKMAPVIKQAQGSGWMDCCVVATAQHRHLLDQVLAQFGVAVDHDLNLMTAGQTLAEITSRSIAALDRVIEMEQPELVIAQGDTTTTFTAALAAFYRGIPFAHVEAGLRTSDLQNPFPEEFNRQATSKITRFHFAPTEGAREALLAEGVDPGDILVTGNTVIDALLMTVSPDLARRPTGRVRKMLLTIHRRENFGEPLRKVGAAIRELLAREPDLQIVWPVHPNPNVYAYAHEQFDGHPRVKLVEPLEYAEFVNAMADAHFIVTDSGGVQEEAPALARPVLVLRATTERPEAIDTGVARLVGTDTQAIVMAVQSLMHDTGVYAGMAKGISPYGDGKAAGRIIERLAESFAISEGSKK